MPIYRERAVLPSLVSALKALDYPIWNLEIFFITEAEDTMTRAALAETGLSPNMAVLTVPSGKPRTKPRALNYALTFATGEIVTVFDAEDVPEPGQLKVAATALRSGGPGLACVQARLDIYNARASFFTRQFTLEYAALFGAILPAYQRLALPIPLGGTSNHFNRRALESIGAWDPYNVTEDADIGIRFARSGLGVAMITSTTWEEAPKSFRQWLGQRTRWIKGWMQTWLVHMRRPKRLRRELGRRAYIGFHLIFGGLVLSALVHPLFYIAIISQLIAGTLFTTLSNGWAAALAGITAFNVIASYASAMALSALVARRRGGRGLSCAVLWLPFYWLLISLAAYLALIDLVRRPHHWAKTAHIVRLRRRSKPQRPLSGLPQHPVRPPPDLARR